MNHDEYDDNDPLSAARGITTAIVWMIWAAVFCLFGWLLLVGIRAQGWL